MTLPRLTKRWEIRERIPVEIDQALGAFPAFFRQILYARGIQDEIQARAYLDGTQDLHNPYDLTGMAEAVDRLVWAMKKNEPVVVYGDYDVDGVTATALLVGVLRGYGMDAEPYIPNRFEEGYGVNLEALETIAAQGARLVVTVDCGIRSPREVEAAEEMGLDIIISDHHQPGAEIPPALAVICPKRPDDSYPDKDLSGVGVAYKIAQALAIRRPEAGVCAEDWLDLVALGTVADVVPLRGENRALVRRGLQAMRRGARPGLLSLANVAGVKIQQIQAGDIAFMLGPRLNAAGRLDTALDSLRLLMANDMMQTGMLAQQLDNQNRHRQELTRKTQDDAIRIAESLGMDGILFAFDPNFKSGVVGLAASRLVEMFYRPAMVGEMGPEYTRASCRSIPEFHITRALDECSDLLVRHGGHALAAGFTIRNENIPELVKRMGGIAARECTMQALRPVLRADLEIPLFELRPDFLHYLDLLQPTGQENAEALFVSRDVRVVKHRTVGGENQHLRLTVSDRGITYDGIAFRQGHRVDNLPERVDVMYMFERNEFNGRVNLQLNIRDFKASGLPD